MGGSIRRPALIENSRVSRIGRSQAPAREKKQVSHSKQAEELKIDNTAPVKTNIASSTKAVSTGSQQKISHSSHPVLDEVAGYSIGHRLGAGSFGDVYYGFRGVEEVAIKFEPKEACNLKKEWKFYQKLSGGPGIPKAYFFGTVGDYNVLVMDLLGPSLDDLWKKCGKQFSLKTMLSIGDQVIRTLQYLHSKGIVHRDLKKQNLCIGRGANAGTIYLVDFGLSAHYVNVATNKHIKDRQTGKVVGTPLYCSVNAHTGREQSRRDDMESLGYVLVGLFQGDLPWRRAGRNRLADAKRQTSEKSLCCGLPLEVQEYLRICRNLEFEAEPPYAELRQLMQKALARDTSKSEKRYDWSDDSSVQTESTRCPSSQVSSH